MYIYIHFFDIFGKRLQGTQEVPWGSPWVLWGIYRTKTEPNASVIDLSRSQRPILLRKHTLKQGIE